MLAAKKSLSRRLSSCSGVRRILSLKRDSYRGGHTPRSRWSLLETLSMEIVLEISAHMPVVSDLLHLCITSHRMFTLMAPHLYSNVELKTNRQCDSWLSSVLQQTGYLQHVRRLVVHPNNSEWTIPERPIDEEVVSNMIEKLAPYLNSLHTFVWDGSEMPVDSLWLALRTSCPALRNISMTVGSKDDILDSHLYEFSDLRSFSLVVKWRSLSWLCDGKLHIERLPKELWTMLIERCPNLEELSLSAIAPSPRLFDIKHIVHGRWPRLKRLTLGDLRLLPKTSDAKVLQSFDQDFKNFFLAHPALTSVTFQHAGEIGNFPESLRILPRSALPCLQSFSGTLRYVRSLPRPHMIQHLSLTCLHYSLSSMPRLVNALATLSSLASLKIWIDLSFDPGRPDHEKVFSNLLSACSQLLHLELLCFTQPTFRVAEFSNALRMCPRIKSFVLTKVYSSHDAKMIDSATQIILDNPSLEKYTLRYSQDSWLSTRGMRPKQVGTYEIVSPSTSRTLEQLDFDNDGIEKASLHDPDHDHDQLQDRLLSVYEWGMKGSRRGRKVSQTYFHRVSGEGARQGQAMSLGTRRSGTLGRARTRTSWSLSTDTTHTSGCH